MSEVAKTEVDWKSPVLRIGQSMATEAGDLSASIIHVDRTRDPYWATVIERGVAIHTGLYDSLSAARASCNERMC